MKAGGMMSHRHMARSAALFNKRHATKGIAGWSRNHKIAAAFGVVFLMYVFAMATGIQIIPHHSKYEIRAKDVTEHAVNIHETIDENENLKSYEQQEDIAVVEDIGLKPGEEPKVEHLGFGVGDEYEVTLAQEEKIEEAEKEDPDNKDGEITTHKINASDVVPKKLSADTDWFDYGEYEAEIKELDWDKVVSSQKAKHKTKEAQNLSDAETVMRYVTGLHEPVVIKNSPARKKWGSATWSNEDSMQSDCDDFVKNFVAKHMPKSFKFNQCQFEIPEKHDKLTSFLETERPKNLEPDNVYFERYGDALFQKTKFTRNIMWDSHPRAKAFHNDHSAIYVDYKMYDWLFANEGYIKKKNFADAIENGDRRFRGEIHPKQFWAPTKDLVQSNMEELYVDTLTTEAKNEKARSIESTDKPYLTIPDAEAKMKYYENKFNTDNTLVYYYLMSEANPVFWHNDKTNDAGDANHSKDPADIPSKTEKTWFTVSNADSHSSAMVNLFSNVVSPMRGSTTVTLWAPDQWKDLSVLPTWHKNFPYSQSYYRESGSLYHLSVKKVEATDRNKKVKPFSVVKLNQGDLLYIPSNWGRKMRCDRADANNDNICVNAEAEVSTPQMKFKRWDIFDDDEPLNFEDYSRNYNRASKTFSEACMDVSYFGTETNCQAMAMQDTKYMTYHIFVRDIQMRCFLEYGKEAVLEDELWQQVVDERRKFSIFNVFNKANLEKRKEYERKFLMEDDRTEDEIYQDEYVEQVEKRREIDKEHMTPHEWNLMKNAPIILRGDKRIGRGGLDAPNETPLGEIMVGVSKFAGLDGWSRVMALIDSAKDTFFPEPKKDQFQDAYNKHNWKLKQEYDAGDKNNGWEPIDEEAREDGIKNGKFREADFEVARHWPCERAAEAAAYTMYEYVAEILRFYPGAIDSSYKLSSKEKTLDEELSVNDVLVPKADAYAMAKKLFRATMERYSTENSEVLHGMKSGFGCMIPEPQHCFNFKENISPMYRDRLDGFAFTAAKESIYEFKKIQRFLVQQRTFVTSDVEPEKPKSEAEKAAAEEEIAPEIDINDFVNDGALDRHFHGAVGMHLSNYIDFVTSVGFNTAEATCYFISCLSIADV